MKKENKEAETRKQAKCKNYFWGFCKLKKADNDNNPEWCDREKCEVAKTKCRKNV